MRGFMIAPQVCHDVTTQREKLKLHASRDWDPTLRLHHHSIDITLCTASASIFISRQHQNSSLSPPFSFDTYNRISGQCLSPCGPSPAGSCGGERGGVRACVRACVCVPWSWASSYECDGHPKQLATAFGDSEVGRRREGARDVSSHIRCAVIATTPTRIDLDRSCALHVNQRHLLRRSRTASQTPHSRKHTRTHAHTHTLTHTHIHTWASRQSCSYHFSRLSFRASYTTDTATRYSP